jgi:hypothetical protein
LIGTNHLVDLGGSETVALEFGQYFRARGASVVAYANVIGDPMKQRFRKAGIELCDEPAAIRPLAFDLVYLQHHVAPLFEYARQSADRPATLVAYGRLAPTGYLESAGWSYEKALGDLVLANSRETSDSLVAQGCALPVKVFHNAAPAAFHRKRESLPDTPRRILVVTNHQEPSLMAAIDLLRQRAHVLHLGFSGEAVRPVTPALIGKHDLVVSIGKTVQYAIAGHTPVFVYDRFGGPGYLDPARWAEAADRNFSGRCTPHRRTPEALAEEILEGYSRGRAFAQATGPEIRRRFHLSRHLAGLAARKPSSNEARRARLGEPCFLRERLMAQHVREQAVLLKAERDHGRASERPAGSPRQP